MPEPDLLALAIPPIAAAVAAYGTAVLSQVEDAAAGETVRLGQRLLTRITRRRSQRLGDAIHELAIAEPDEIADATASVRLELRRLLREDAQLRDDLAALFAAAPNTITASGERSVAIGGDVTGIVTTGDGSFSVQHRQP